MFKILSQNQTLYDFWLGDIIDDIINICGKFVKTELLHFPYSISKLYLHSTYFLCFLLHNIRKWQDSRKMGRPILITLYHFHLFREHLEIS